MLEQIDAYNTINVIKKVKVAERVYDALQAFYAPLVSESQLAHDDWMFRTATFYKENGGAWWRDRCRSMVNKIVTKTAVKSHWEEPSEETLAWGGFLSGTQLVYTDASEQDEVVGKLISIINEAKSA